MPPQTAILVISGSSIALRIAATIAAGWSPTTSMRATGWPAANAWRASRLELVSCVWPLRISSPTVTIAVRPVAFGTVSA
jgi:alkanesulfonate monooxygenase SsuD/methylene tetrahydromethanopterin reductase-like flavin-dependent oxidoreductase (luciferase family)